MTWILGAAFLISTLLTNRMEADLALRPPTVPFAVSAQSEELPANATPGAVPNADADIATGEDLTCSDFASQAEAQAAFEAAGTGDPHGLDLDLDGVACETPFVTPTVEADSPIVDRAPASPAPLDGRAVNCIDFAFQEDAQVIYDRIPGDPYNLDPSGDGFACASLPSRGS